MERPNPRIIGVQKDEDIYSEDEGWFSKPTIKLIAGSPVEELEKGVKGRRRREEEEEKEEENYPTMGQSQQEANQTMWHRVNTGHLKSTIVQALGSLSLQEEKPTS